MNERDRDTDVRPSAGLRGRGVPQAQSVALTFSMVTEYGDRNDTRDRQAEKNDIAFFLLLVDTFTDPRLLANKITVLCYLSFEHFFLRRVVTSLAASVVIVSCHGICDKAYLARSRYPCSTEQELCCLLIRTVIVWVFFVAKNGKSPPPTKKHVLCMLTV